MDRIIVTGIALWHSIQCEHFIVVFVSRVLGLLANFRACVWVYIAFHNITLNECCAWGWLLLQARGERMFHGKPRLGMDMCPTYVVVSVS